jgi:hypothetical protein
MLGRAGGGESHMGQRFRADSEAKISSEKTTRLRARRAVAPSGIQGQNFTLWLLEAADLDRSTSYPSHGLTG